MTYRPKVLLDSGAYTAWTRRVQIDIDAYCNFILENGDWVQHYVALDVIRPDLPEYAAEQSFANWQHMRKRGLDPWPVFHQGEDIRWLHKYLDAGCRYIGVSASSLRRRPAAYNWYEIVWAHLVNKDGYPIVRGHMFGDTRERMLLSFPWASNDSTAWSIYTQVYTSFWIYDIMLSQRLDEGPGHGTRDIDNLSLQERAEVSKVLKMFNIRPDIFDTRPGRRGTQGYNPEVAMRSANARSYLMVKWYERLEARANAQIPLRFQPRRGLIDAHQAPATAMDPAYDAFAMYFVLGNSSQTCPVLRLCKHEPVLASYYYLACMSARNNRLEEVRGFARNPENVYDLSPRMQEYARSLDTIFERTPCEGTGTLPLVEPVQPAHQPASLERQLPGYRP